MKVAAVGEAMIELSLVGDSSQVAVAGDTLNTAVYLKRTAPDIEVHYVTKLGTDTFSARIVDFMASEGLETRSIEYDPNGTPGLYAINTDENGERSFTYWREASAARRMFQAADGLNFEVLAQFDLIYLSGISLAILPANVRTALMDWLGTFVNDGGRVAYDNNFRPRLWTRLEAAESQERMWDIADIALPSLDDEMDITGIAQDDIIGMFLDRGRSGALKRGAAGPLCLETGQISDYPSAQRVVDTTAAGDSFNGGYLGARLSGATQEDALSLGHALAAQVVGYRGAIMPASTPINLPRAVIGS